MTLRSFAKCVKNDIRLDVFIYINGRKGLLATMPAKEFAADAFYDIYKVLEVDTNQTTNIIKVYVE